MLCEALYYPHMRIDNSAWLRSQLLYFDRINTISPWHVQEVPPSSDELYLHEAGVLVRQSPTLMKESVEKTSRLMAMLLVASRNGGLGSHFTGNPTYAKPSRDALQMLSMLNESKKGKTIRKLVPHMDSFSEELQASISDNYVQMHPEKLHWILKNFLRGGNRAEEAFGDLNNWIDVDSVFASVYMTILAREMSSAMGASGITDEAVHDALYQDIMATNTFSPRQTARRAEGVVVDIVMKSIKLAPDTSLPKILRFRENHSDELGRFRTVINEAASRCAIMGDADDIRHEAKLIFDREINPSVIDLEKSLSAVGIVWTRSGVMKATSLIVGIAAGLATYDFTGSHYWALSTSVGLGLMGFSLSEAGDRQAARETSPYCYLLNLRREFGETAT